MTLSVGCGGSSPAGPSTPPTTTPTVNNNCTVSQNCPLQPPGINLFIRTFIQSGQVGSFTITFAGQTLTSTTARDFLFNNLAAGDYDVTGQYSGAITSMGFSVLRAANTDNSGGGGQPGSVQSIDGPLPDIGPCKINYQDFGANASTVHTFHWKFTVNSSLAVGSTC